MSEARTATTKVTAEAVERLKQRLGIPVRWLDRPRNTVATADSMRDFAVGYGDDNPLYIDPAYGEHTRWDGIIGPPLYFMTTGEKADTPWTEAEAEAMSGGDPLRGVGQYLSSDVWQLLAPVRPGLALQRTRHLHDIELRSSSFGGGHAAVLTYRVTYTDSDGRVYAINDRSYHHAEREKSAGTAKYRDIEISPYSDEEIDAIYMAYENEWRRGADRLRVGDVAVGDSLPSIVKGPLTLTDILCYHVGLGMGGIDGALKLAHKTRKTVPGWFTRNALNVPDIVQRCHWENDYAQQLGQPAAYDYGAMRTNWMVHLVTNWMGDEGWISHLSTRARRFNYIGDTHWLRGKVEAIDADGPVRSVAVSIEGVNQRGETTCTGQATVLLGSDGEPALPVPAPVMLDGDRCPCRQLV